MSKVRLDLEMVKRGLSQSREKARAQIMAGEVRVNGERADKAGQEIREDAEIVIIEDAIPYVSRGGLKLEKAITVFPIDLKDRTCADIGASTGGFTDVMLKNGASLVYAIDVGYGQLAWSLRNDSRVVVMERTNARNISPDWFSNPISFASIDVSFISLKLILPPLIDCLPEGGEVVALIKPQFEAGRSEVGKNGVVRDRKIHKRVCQEIMTFADSQGYTVRGLSYSPIKGPKGNIEFLLYMQKCSTKKIPSSEDFGEIAQKTVDLAHETGVFR